MKQESMFLSVIKKRRSIRRFSARPVEQKKIDILVEAALRAPSSRGLNPWEFVVVNDAKILERLSHAKPHGSAFLKEASLAMVVCARPDVSDVWVEDASIATIFIHLAAASVGLGSCWVQIRKRRHDEKDTAEDFVRGTLLIPEIFSVEAIVAVGYPAEKKQPHQKESLPKEKVHVNAYGQTLPA